MNLSRTPPMLHSRRTRDNGGRRQGGGGRGQSGRETTFQQILLIKLKEV